MNRIPRYQGLLQQIAGSQFNIELYIYGDRLPYCWKVRTTVEPIQYVGMIQFVAEDIAFLTGKSDSESIEYLRSRYQRLFAIPSPLTAGGAHL